MKKIKLTNIIDDGEIIIYLSMNIVKEVKFCKKLDMFTYTNEALFSFKTRISKRISIPDIIPFDLKMPEMDGWQFIEVFNEIPDANKNPEFVFTSSVDPKNIYKASQINTIKTLLQSHLQSKNWLKSKD